MKKEKKYLISELSVFFPCYNEEKNLQNTIDKSITILDEVAQKWEIIIINDGSKDKTEVIAKKIKKQYKNKDITIITHNPNRGYGGALKSGLYNSKYNWITFTDSDGQFDFSDLKTLINTQKNTKSDLVIGFYLGRKVPFYRICGSKLWQLAVFILFGLKVKDIDCGFKLLNKEVEYEFKCRNEGLKFNEECVNKLSLKLLNLQI
jgi:glycosyltransferase involved in cell wall biosynthesis